MEFVNIQYAKTYLSRLLARVRNGEEIVIASRGAPFAKLVPYGAGVPRRELIGSDDQKVVIHPDFYEPVGQEHLSPFYEPGE